MGRQRRPFLPGAIFHLTARTIRHQLWITPPLRTQALRVVGEAVPRSGSRLLAVAVMSNHIHLVAQQGHKPLSRLMQPILRRLALLVQEAHGLKGPVFWRHYSSQHCFDPSYARNAIVYAHLNPVRAGLCSRPSEYAWTSHSLYVGTKAEDLPPELRPLESAIDPSVALPLFASDLPRSRADLQADYRRFVEQRLRLDALALDGEERPDPPMPPPNVAILGSLGTWSAALTPLFHAPIGSGSAPEVVLRGLSLGPDMTTIARRTLRLEGSRRSVESICGRRGGREASRLRHAIMRRLHAAGYKNVRIAEFLNVSESAVSHVLRRPPGRE